MDAIVTAGGTPRIKEPLYPQTQGGYKAMLNILDRPMIQWVLDALDGASGVERVVVVGLPPAADLKSHKLAAVIEDHGDMLANNRAGAEYLAAGSGPDARVLTVASDIPTITAQMVDWMVEQVQASDHDFYYQVVERKVMETRFSGSRRTYTSFKDVEVCGGDLNAYRLGLVTEPNALWNKLIDARKSPLRQASLLGYDTLLMVALRQLTLQEAERVVSSRLGIRGRVILSPYAEMGMDVDKPFQLDLVRAELGRAKSL